MFFQCFSIFSPLCSCAGQDLLDRIEIVSVTTFFLMKNVLRHGRKKKIFVLGTLVCLEKSVLELHFFAVYGK